MFRFLTEGLGWIIGTQFLLIVCYFFWSSKIDGIFSIYKYDGLYAFFLFFGFFCLLLFARNVLRTGTLRRVGAKSERALQAQKSGVDD
jgi:hypothetical protein